MRHGRRAKIKVIPDSDAAEGYITHTSSMWTAFQTDGFACRSPPSIQSDDKTLADGCAESVGPRLMGMSPPTRTQNQGRGEQPPSGAFSFVNRDPVHLWLRLTIRSVQCTMSASGIQSSCSHVVAPLGNQAIGISVIPPGLRALVQPWSANRGDPPSLGGHAG